MSSLLVVGAFAQGWLCYGGNPQHTGMFVGTSQTATTVKWQTPLDDNRAYYGGEVLIHYAAPMVTPANNVVIGYRYTTSVSGNQNYDNWKVVGHSGANGNTLWSLNTDYSAALIFPNDWTTVFPITLFQSGAGSNIRGVAAAGAAGSVMVRASADAASSTAVRYIFYTTLADFNRNKASYQPVKINTPITADASGNLYFGYEVTASVPSNLAKLGSGGIAKVNAHTGASIFMPVGSMNVDSSLSRPAMNASPALTVDGQYIYVALSGGNPFLVKLKTKDLSTVAKAHLYDPSIPGANIVLINESSAAPMIGLDGHVFMGVFGNQYRESHGWMLQFDANLSQADSNNKRYPVGAFGWDDTAVVVPSTMVPSYKGKASYLVLTKYNNYDMGGDAGADGSNKLAVLDPTSDSVTTDRQSGIPVMNEILTVLGVTKTNDDPNHPNAVNEWCINSAAIDVNRKSAIINSEDGHMYRWSFVTNSLTESLDLQPATGEAYTETAIGPNGVLYVINNTILFAIGSNNATSVSVAQGTGVSGNVQSIWYLDGKSFMTNSVNTTSGQTATIEADFVCTGSNSTSLNVTSVVSAAANVNGTMSLYNYTSKKFVSVATQTLTSTLAPFNAAVKTNVSEYVGPGGKVRVRITGVLPPAGSNPRFPLAIDIITAGLS